MQYALLMVVETPDNALQVWEQVAEAIRSHERVVYLSDPYAVPERHRGAEFATREVQLWDETGDMFALTDSALET